MTEKSRLGRDPFQNKKSSPVRSIVQNKVSQVQSAPQVEAARAQRGLLDRVNEMKIELDLRQFIRALIT
jgi:hypothetical protein